MKKLFTFFLGGFIVLSALGLVSCVNDLTIDTIIGLDKPSNVKASAFTGGNYVFWNPVKDADVYKIFRIENADTDNELKKYVGDSSTTSYADIVSYQNVITNGTLYKYEVVASVQDSQHGVYVRDSDAGRSNDFVTANIPSVGSSVSTPSSSPRIGNAYILVPFTQTAGYTYEFRIASGAELNQKSIRNAFEDSDNSVSVGAEFTGSVSNIARLSIPSSGVQNVLVKVSSVSELYDANYANLGSVTVPSIGEITSTSNAKAQYTSETSVLVSWTPAVLSSGNAPTSYYKVYRAVDGIWTQVSGSISEGINVESGKEVASYSITDSVSNNQLDYTYYVVLTNGTNFGSTKSAALSKYTINEITSTSNVKADYTSETSVLVSWTPAVLSSGNAPTYYYKVYRAVDGIWTQVLRSISEGINVDGNVSYSMTDSVSNNQVDYTYYVVLANGTTQSAILSKYVVATTDAPIFESLYTYIDGSDNKSDRIKAVVKKANDKQTLSLSYVKLSEDVYDNAITSYVSNNFAELLLDNENGYEDFCIGYVWTYGTTGTYLLKLTASENGKKDNSVYRTVTVNDATVSVGNLKVTYSEDSRSHSSNAYVKISETINSNTDYIGNYSYTLYKVVTNVSSSYADSVTVSTTEVASLDFSNVTPVYSSNWCEYSIQQSVDKKSTYSYTTTEYYVVKSLSSDSTKKAKQKAADGINIPYISYSTYNQKVTWDSVDKATTYQVYYYQTTDGNLDLTDFPTSNFTADNSADTNNTEYSVVPAWTQYKYIAVKASGFVNGSSETSEFSNVIRISPSTPSSPSISSSGKTLTWNLVDGATDYYIYYFTSDTKVSYPKDNFTDSSVSKYSIYLGTDTSHDVSSYVSFAKYTYFAVRAYKSDESAYTDYSSVIEFVPTSAPTNLTYSSGSLSWNTVDGATNYYIYRNTTGDFSSTSNYDNYYSTSSTYCDVSSSSGTTYYYAVKAYKNGEYTDFSNVVAVN